MSHRLSLLSGTGLLSGRRLWLACLAVISLAALTAAALLTVRIGDSRISIGLDTDVRFAVPPAVSWGEGEANRATFEAVPAAFAATQPFLELIPAAEKNPLSTGFDIWIGQHPRIERARKHTLRKRFHPFDPGQRHLWYQINDPQEGGAFVWERNADTPTLVFLKTPESGMIRFRTPDGESQLDLYSPVEEVVVVAEDQLRAARYHATVPRRALRDLRITLPVDPPATVHRLYVGTLVPYICFTGERAYPGYAATPLLGHVQTHWQQPENNGAIQLQRAPLEQGGVATFFALFALLWAGLTAMLLTARGLWWLFRRSVADAAQPLPELQPIQARRFFVFFAAFCTVYLFYLGCAYPGLMSPDSVMQWEQAHTWELTDAHPALNTLSYKLIAAVWDSTAAVALLQVLGMSLALAYAYSLLLRTGVPNMIVVLLFHIALLSPKNGILSVTLWKDVPFSILVLAISTLLLRLCYQRKKGLEPFYWIALGLALGLLPLVRHNGLVILLGIAPLLPFLFWRWKVRALLLATLLSLVLFASAKYGVFRALDVKGWEGLNSYLYTMKSAILIDQDVPLSRAEYEFLNQVRPIGEDRWAYNSHTGNTTVNESYNKEFAAKNEEPYSHLFKDLAPRYPLLLVQDHLERSHFVWAPAHPEGRVLHREHYLSRPENRWEYQQGDYPTRTFFPRVAPVLGDLITVLQQGPCILFRPAVCLYLVVLSLVILAIRMRLPLCLVAFLPALLSTLSVLMVPVASQIRYQFPLTLTAGFLVGLAFMTRPAEKAGLSGESTESSAE